MSMYIKILALQVHLQKMHLKCRCVLVTPSSWLAPFSHSYSARANQGDSRSRDRRRRRQGRRRKQSQRQKKRQQRKGSWVGSKAKQVHTSVLPLWCVPLSRNPNGERRSQSGKSDLLGNILPVLTRPQGTHASTDRQEKEAQLVRCILFEVPVTTLQASGRTNTVAVGSSLPDGRMKAKS